MTEKLTRHDLKDDALLTQTAKTADYVAHHTRTILIAAGALVVAAAAVLIIRASAARAEEKAAEIALQAEIDFKRGDHTAAAGRLDEIVTNHGGTRAGKRSRLLHADVMFAQGRYEDALRYYTQAEDHFRGNPIIAASARSGLAACQESLGRYDQAAETWGRLAADAPNEVLRAEYLLAQSRSLLRAGKNDDARRVLEAASLLTVNPRAVQEAKIQLAEMKALVAN